MVAVASKEGPLPPESEAAVPQHPPDVPVADYCNSMSKRADLHEALIVSLSLEQQMKVFKWSDLESCIIAIMSFKVSVKLNSYTPNTSSISFHVHL